MSSLEDKVKDIHKEVFGECWVSPVGGLGVSEKAIGTLCDYITDLRKRVEDLEKIAEDLVK